MGPSPLISHLSIPIAAPFHIKQIDRYGQSLDPRSEASKCAIIIVVNVGRNAVNIRGAHYRDITDNDVCINMQPFPGKYTTLHSRIWRARRLPTISGTVSGEGRS